jgi:hypothetical protein
VFDNAQTHSGNKQILKSRVALPHGRARQASEQENIMNSIIYIVGLVVIIGAVLSYFGFR